MKLSRLKAPKFSNTSVVIRAAENKEEIEAANRLVFANYVDKGYWDSGQDALQQNKYLHSPRRTAFVALDAGSVIGTASIIFDSNCGLPADHFRPELMRRLRSAGDRIAEVSALAVDRAYAQQRDVVLFLFKFVYQYSFYYAGVDRFVVVCTPRHAVFYETFCRFQKIAPTGRYDYVGVEAQLLTVHLVNMHKRFVDADETALTDPNSFYRFLLVDDHPSLRFPEKKPQRLREINWAKQAELMDLPIAV